MSISTGFCLLIVHLGHWEIQYEISGNIEYRHILCLGASLTDVSMLIYCYTKPNHRVFHSSWLLVLQTAIVHSTTLCRRNLTVQFKGENA